MALKITARHGGAVAASQDDITDRVPFLDGTPGTPIVQMGMSVQNGGASQGTVLVPDPTANDDASLYFPPHTQITMTEDATGDELMLAQGRISGFQIGRAPGSEVDHEVEWTLTIDDANVDLRGLAFTEDWVRPAETGMARLYALALYTLNGTSSTRPNVGGVITYRPSTTIVISSSHLAPNSNTTLMPAKTYPIDTQPQSVVDDCVTTEGKVYGVVPHHVGGSSHLCMLVIKESDHTTYPSAVKISDQLADWDPDDLTAPVFEPWWDQGKGQTVDGNANISGIVSRYGPDDKAIILVNSTLGNANEYWVEAYQDGASVDATQAAARAQAIIDYRSPFAEQDRCSIEVWPEQHHLITAGMSIKIKTAVTAAGTVSTVGTYINRRIVSLVWEPRVNGKLHAILQLNRPTRAAGAGASQPASTTPSPAPGTGCIDTFSRTINPGAWGEGEWNLTWSLEVDAGAAPGDPALVPTAFSVDGSEGIYHCAIVDGAPNDASADAVVSNPDWVIGTEMQVDGTVYDTGGYAIQAQLSDNFYWWMKWSYGDYFVYFYVSATNPTSSTATWEAWLVPHADITTSFTYVIGGDPGPDAVFIGTWTTIMATTIGSPSPDMTWGCAIRVEAATVTARAWGPAGPGTAGSVTITDTTFDPAGITFDPENHLVPDIILGGDTVYGIDRVMVSGGNCGGSSSWFALLDDPRFGEVPTEYNLGLGDGVTTVYFVPVSPYVPGSLRVWVDGLEQTAAISESDPATGEFTFSFAPEATERITVWYQVDG